MNINRVYKCNICKLVDRKYIDEDNINFDFEFIESRLVYMNDMGKFIDLETKKKYNTGYICSDIGDLFVNIEDEMIPISMLISFNKTDITKRRILKKYNEFMRSGDMDEY